MRRISALLLAAAVLAGPATALAARLTEISPPPAVGTAIDGFNQVMGPSATEPEHAGGFVRPPPEPCPSCPRPAPPAPVSRPLPARQ